MQGNPVRQDGSTPAAAIHVDIAVVGASGRVAQRLLQLIASQHAELLERGIQLRLVAVANSRSGVVDAAGIALDDAVSALSLAPACTLQQWSDQLLALPCRPRLLVDCTASAEVAARYPEWLAAGFDVVTPNKHGPAGDAALQRAIATAQTQSGTRLAFENTVGAQLPLLRTLRDLAASGDRIITLDAVLSGTLSYVFQRIRDGVAFSTALREAIQRGYAEPDPAADLGGADVARKLVVLLRAAGVDIDVADVQLTPPVPAECLVQGDAEALLAGLSASDADWARRAADAEAAGECWIYRADYRDGIARVDAERVPVTNTLARLAPCENALQLSTRLYRDAPLTICGPGAGIDLTAAGVYADLLDLLQRHRPAVDRSHAASASTLRAA